MCTVETADFNAAEFRVGPVEVSREPVHGQAGNSFQTVLDDGFNAIWAIEKSSENDPLDRVVEIKTPVSPVELDHSDGLNCKKFPPSGSVCAATNEATSLKFI